MLINARLARAAAVVFCTAYVGVVLPFSTSFFRSFTGLDTTQMLLGLRLDWVMQVALPVFLAAFEFFSFNLGCLVWIRLGRSRRSSALVAMVLFGACQLVPVAATFVSTQRTEYDAYIKGRARHRQDASRTQDRADVLAKMEFDGRIADLKRLERLRAQLLQQTAANRARLSQLERAPRAEQQPEDIAEIARLRVSLDDDRHGRAEYDRQIRALTGQRVSLVATESRTQDAGHDPDEAFGEYIAVRLGSFQSILSLCIALIFPVGVLGATYVVTLDAQDHGRDVADFDLSRQLAFGASQRAAAQLAHAKMLKPVVGAHFAARDAVQRLSDETVIFQLLNEARLAEAREIGALKTQVVESPISEAAKTELIDYINGIERRSIFTKQREAV